MKDLKSELSKNLERLIIGLMLTPAEFDAKMMRKAMEVGRDGGQCIYSAFVKDSDTMTFSTFCYVTALF